MAQPPIRSARKRRLPPAALAILLLCACHAERNRRREQQREVQVTSRDSLLLGPGDIRIVNTDSSVELALIGDKVVSGLADKTLRDISRKTDTSDDSGSGLGASMARMIKSAVRGAVSRQVSYPVADIQDVRYENGRLAFIWKDGKPMTLLDHTTVNGKKVLDSFDAAQAQAFVVAFRARKAELTRGPT